MWLLIQDFSRRWAAPIVACGVVTWSFDDRLNSLMIMGPMIALILLFQWRHQSTRVLHSIPVSKKERDRALWVLTVPIAWVLLLTPVLIFHLGGVTMGIFPATLTTSLERVFFDAIVMGCGLSICYIAAVRFSGATWKGAYITICVACSGVVAMLCGTEKHPGFVTLNGFWAAATIIVVVGSYFVRPSREALR